MNELQEAQLKKAKLKGIEKGGLCLSEKYENSDEKLIWQCSNATHSTWLASHYKVVKAGRWCPACAIESKANKLINKNALEIAKKHAESKGGFCLSTEYKNNKGSFIWKCKEPEHKEWIAQYASVISGGHWCPLCSRGKDIENKTRIIFEVFFGQPFPSVRPQWNSNPWSSWPLELDGLCSIFNLAFEHDGEHHHEIGRYSNKNKKSDFIYQKFKDEQKKKNCLANGITLVRVPILKQKDRKSFSITLENVAYACQLVGIEMTPTPQQLIEMERRFNQ